MKKNEEIISNFLKNTIISFFLIGLASIVIYLSWAYLNDMKLSKLTSDWGGFGSFISGVFAPLSSLAVIVTIYVFQKQYNQQFKIFNEQQAAEEYKSHKADFLIGLSSIEEKYSEYIKINGKVELYNIVFPENSFTNFKRTIVLKPLGNSKNGEIERVFYAYKKLYEYLSQSKFENSHASKILILFYQINHFLGIALRKNNEVGDILMIDINPNLNILHIDNILGAIFSILNFILTYSDSELSIKQVNETNNVKRFFLSISNTKLSSKSGYYMIEDTKIRKIIKAHNFSEKTRAHLEKVYISSSDYLLNYSKRNLKEEDRILSILNKTYHDSMNHDIRRDISSNIY